jgi:hypothetical protein
MREEGNGREILRMFGKTKTDGQAWLIDDPHKVQTCTEEYKDRWRGLVGR